MATNVHFDKKPTGFRILDEGEHNLRIESVKGLPRAKVTNVEVEFVSEDGIKLKNKYDLKNDGGYAAFYWLVKNGLGVDLDEGDSFDIDQMEGRFVRVEIVHKNGTKVRDDGTVPVFANIKSTLGPGTPFGEDAQAPAAAGGDDEDEW